MNAESISPETINTVGRALVYLILLLGFFFKLKSAVDTVCRDVAEVKSALFENGDSKFVAKSHCSGCSEKMMGTLCRKIDALQKSNDQTMGRIFVLVDEQTKLAAETRERVASLEAKRG